VKLQNRTISAILVWVAIALLILNGYLKSSWVFLACIVMVMIAVLIYFVPRLKK